MPRVEVGGHTAFVKKLSVSPDGSMLLTVAADKTARLWDAANGRLLHILRVPMLAGHEGQLYAGAVSPDSKLAAVGGFTGFGEAGAGTLYLYSTRTGKLITRIKGLPAFSIENIAFAPRGNVLAICFADGAGVMFLDWVNQKFLRADRSATDKILGADFAAGGDLAITTLDGKLLVYEAATQYTRIRTRALTEGTAPMHVRYSPDGSKLAIGFDRDPVFVVLDAASLESIATVRLAPATAQRGLHVVDWSDDGKSIYAGGQSSNVATSPVLRWSVQGNAEPQRVLIGGERISDIRRLPGGAMAFSSGEPEVGVVNADGRVRWRLRGSALGFVDATIDLRTSARGDIVEFNGGTGGAARLRFDANARPDLMVTRVAGVAAELAPTRREAPGWSVRSSDDGERLFLNATAATLRHREQATTWAFPPGSESVLVGTTWFLRRYDRRAALQWSQALPAQATAISVTADGALAVVAVGDGTLRWYRVEDGVEVAALFVNRNAIDWIAWIPAGYYASSLSGDNYIGWHVNRGWDKDPDFFRAVQFERILYRPDIVRRYLGQGGKQSVTAIARDAGAFDIANLSAIAPPMLQLDIVARDSLATVTVVGESRSLPLQDWAAFVDDIPIIAARQRALRAEETLSFRRTISVPLYKSTSKLRIESNNGKAMGVVEAELTSARPATPQPGRLLVAAIGVSDFADAGVPDLQFAARDASELADYFKSARNAGFVDVETLVLAERKPATLALIEELRNFLARATAQDTVIVFLASHGLSDPAGNYYFVPQDGRLQDMQAAMAGNAAPSLVRWDVFSELLRGTAGRRLLIVDTCSSAAIGGTFDVHSLAKRSMSSNFALMAAARGDEESQEFPAARHGLFTYSLLEGLRSAYDTDADGVVSLSEAFEYAFDKVQMLRNRAVGAQTPQLAAPDALAQMPLAAGPLRATQRQAIRMH